MVKDYLALIQPSEMQAVFYVILRLQKNARCWWEAELASRGGHRPDTLEELMMLLRAQFESPVRENRARAELLRLQQRSTETASTYMARMKTLLTKVPGYDYKTALQQWILGLRQPFRLEAAKAYPKTLAEAEALVCRLEDAMEFCKGGREDSSKQKASGSGNQDQQKKKSQRYRQTGGPRDSGKISQQQ